MANERFLGRARPSATANANVSLPTNQTVTEIWVSNTSGADATFRIFYDNGTQQTYDESRSLFYNITLRTGRSISIQGRIPLGNGSIGVRTSVASALTFTFFGEDTT